MNWFDALVDCRKRGMRLASIENDEERDNLVAKIASSVKGMLILVHIYCRRNFRELVYYS